MNMDAESTEKERKKQVNPLSTKSQLPDSASESYISVTCSVPALDKSCFWLEDKLSRQSEGLVLERFVSYEMSAVWA